MHNAVMWNHTCTMQLCGITHAQCSHVESHMHNAVMWNHTCTMQLCGMTHAQCSHVEWHMHNAVMWNDTCTMQSCGITHAHCSHVEWTSSSPEYLSHWNWLLPDLVWILSISCERSPCGYVSFLNSNFKVHLYIGINLLINSKVEDKYSQVCEEYILRLRLRIYMYAHFIYQHFLHFF